MLYPEIEALCEQNGFNADSSSNFWIMEKMVAYRHPEELTFYRMTEFNKWEEDRTLLRWFYDAQYDVYPIPQEIVDRYGFKFNTMKDFRAEFRCREYSKLVREFINVDIHSIFAIVFVTESVYALLSLPYKTTLTFIFISGVTTNQSTSPI